MHDIWFENFNGAGSIALKFYNADGNAMERTRATGLMFSGNTIGVEFDYDTAHSLSQSFGYSDWSFNFVNGPGSGQFGVQILHGLLYHSKLHVVGNVDTGGWLMNVAAPGGAGVSQVFDTAFNIYAEGGGNGIEVGSGAEFAGYGNVDLVEVSGTKATNANSAGWTPTFRVSPGAPAVWPGDAGTISNFFGGGQSASFYPLIAPDYSNPYSAFGALTGPNIFSTFTTLYNGAANAFIVYSCPASPASLAACTDKFHADQAGDVNAQGSMTWGGGATIPNSSNVALAGANGLSAGTVTQATGAGSHTFTTAYSAAPTCTATDTTAAVAVQVTSSTTAVTLAGTGTDVIAWQCAPAVN